MHGYISDSFENKRQGKKDKEITLYPISLSGNSGEVFRVHLLNDATV